MGRTVEVGEKAVVGESFGTRVLRRPVIATVIAIGLVGGVCGAAEAGTSLTSSTNVASSVQGALVDIVSTEKYAGAVAAGTGMVVTSDGEILTNNHVINGATSIKVTVVSSGKSYSASVVGTDPTDDVAVIQLKGASGLKTLPIGNASSLSQGQKVVARGNAGGTGTISTVSGTVTALNQSITASSDDGSGAEQLTGLIETDAPIVAGDSGGALATTSGKVIGMNTAAAVTNSMSKQAYGGSDGSGSSAAASDAYAIPIQSALDIASKIVNGEASSAIHIGIQGFLGVELQAAAASHGYSRGYGGYGYGNAYGFGSAGTTSNITGVTIAGVIDGGAAAAAGLTAGDVITSVDGKAVDSATTLSTIMDGTSSGEKVSVGWTDSSGASHTTRITLAAGPAD